MRKESFTRKFRKSQRQTKNAFIARPAKFFRWHWYDWLFSFFALVLILYAVGSLIFLSLYVRSYEKTTLHDIRIRETRSLLQDFKNHHQYGYSICLATIAAEVYLILVLIFSLIWVRFLRNLGFFIIGSCLLLIAMFFFLAITITAINTEIDVEGFIEDLYKYTTDHMNKDLYARAYFFKHKIYALQDKYRKCCGIKRYTDWKVWNKINYPLFNNDNSVPTTCCLNRIPGDEAVPDQTCNNKNILEEPPQSGLVKKSIHTEGCGQYFRRDYDQNLYYYIINGIVITVLLLIILCLLAYLIWRGVGGYLGTELFDDPREQERDEMESCIIPGTPTTSNSLSNSQIIYYAP